MQWDNPGYLDALRYLMEDERVGMIGLCNFNTEHLLRTIESGVHVHTNQVQVGAPSCVVWLDDT